MDLGVRGDGRALSAAWFSPQHTCIDAGYCPVFPAVRHTRIRGQTKGRTRTAHALAAVAAGCGMTSRGPPAAIVPDHRGRGGHADLKEPTDQEAGSGRPLRAMNSGN